MPTFSAPKRSAVFPSYLLAHFAPVNDTDVSANIKAFEFSYGQSILPTVDTTISQAFHEPLRPTFKYTVWGAFFTSLVPTLYAAVQRSILATIIRPVELPNVSAHGTSLVPTLNPTVV